MKRKVRIFLDSGAATLYNKWARTDKKAIHMGSFLKDRKYDDFSWLKNSEYLEYRDQYIDMVKEHNKLINVYANLDIINNPEATWENQKYLEKKGLSPLPVFHFGEDPKWLEKYLAEGYDYIALGGMVPNSAPTLIPGLDRLWQAHLVDKSGMPKVRVHGFAATSILLMSRYPWYSVDSASWIKYSLYGIVLMPRNVQGVVRYDKGPQKISVSNRPAAQTEKGTHINTLNEKERATMIGYMESCGFHLGKTKDKIVSADYKCKKGVELEVGDTDEKKKLFSGKRISQGKRVIQVIVEPGLCNKAILRDEFNALYYIGFQESLPKWPWRFKIKKRGILL